MDFNELGINPIFIKALKKQGITTPTQVQEKVIPKLFNGADLIVQSETGSGKSLAFLLPLLQSIDVGDKTTQALIIVPTRELALQISNVAESFAALAGIDVLSLYGGKRTSDQIKKIKLKKQVIVATPGRLIDHVMQDRICLSTIKFLVLDEADQLLLAGFNSEIEKIISEIPGNRQTIFISATMPSNIKKFAYRYTYEPEFIMINHRNLYKKDIAQFVIPTTDRQKFPALNKVLLEDNPYLAIIFCRTKRRADELQAKMKKYKFDSDVIHSDISQNKRERILNKFKKGDLQFLIATDVAARGLDINYITHIYNFDIPESVETYVHRIGRTGRAGESGFSYTFTTPDDEQNVNEIENTLQQQITRRLVSIGGK